LDAGGWTVFVTNFLPTGFCRAYTILVSASVAIDVFDRYLRNEQQMDVHAEAAAGVRSGESALSSITPANLSRIDGRRLRSERTKQLIMEAFLALLRESATMPTAAQIAERAGYSVRSIFERFPDLNALRVATVDYSLAQSAALAPPRHVDGDRQTRIKSQVGTRAGTCERGVALWRVFLHTVDESDELKLRLRIARQRTIDRLEIMYRPELATLGEVERKYLLIALEALTDMESWARMREMYGMSFEEGCAVWIHAIDRMLPTIPAGPS
jgi:AcrR family transcriptional regulator